MERRERYEEHLTDPATTLGIGANEWPEFLHSDFQEGDEATSIHEDRGAESASTDDLVRVYLREMGSVRLLSRQGEIDLAQRMERGKMRMCKALSRSPLVWQSVLTMYEDALQAKVGLEDFIELGADNREDRQLELTRRLAQFDNGPRAA